MKIWEIKMTNLMFNHSNKIIIYIFAPLLMNFFIVKGLSFNVAYLIFIMQIAIFFTSIKKNNIRISKADRTSLGLIYLIFIFAIISSLFSTYQIDSLRISMLVFITSIMLYLLTMFDDNPIRTFYKLHTFNMLIGVLTSIFGISLLLLGSVGYKMGSRVLSLSLGGINFYQVIMGMPPIYRIASIASNPNTLGIILMFSQLSTIFLLKTRKIDRIKFILLFAFQIFALLLTQSRGAIITSIIMIILFTYFSTKNRVRYVLFLIVIIVISVVLLVTFNQDISILSRFDEGLSGRDQAWKIIISRITQNPFMGVGFGVSSLAYLEDLGIKAHNVYLNTMIEIGFFGFVLFISIWMLALIKSFINIKRKDLSLKHINILIFSIMFSLLFHQLVENKLLVYDYVMFFWVYNISSVISINNRS
ncbi:MAG: O-antigen ligase family protein [Firmicutes bacterium]|nr:O-antigen ligase family protein [Bacillota bacterium]